MTPTPIKILLADDHRFFRDGVRSLLESVAGFEVVGEAGNGEQAVSQAALLKPDVILMDVQMPGLNGVEATRRIIATQPQMAVLMVTMFEDTDLVVAAMRAGARGYILKDAGEDEMTRSIRAVHSGEALFGPAVARRLLSIVLDGKIKVAPPRPNGAPFEELSDRELGVLKMLSLGQSVSSISETTKLSAKTVRNYISNILGKLHAVDRADLINRARAAGLTE